MLNDAVLILRGSVASSTSPITLTDNSSLSSTAPVNRPLVVQDASLGAYAAGAISTRDLTLSSNTLLQFALNSPTDPNNTLFHVQGDLTLDGLLALQNGASPPPGDYTLFTYTGSLTDDGLTLPSSPALAFSLNTTAPGSVILHVAAVPEPASLSLLSLTLPLLLRRRARNSSRRPV